MCFSIFFLYSYMPDFFDSDGLLCRNGLLVFSWMHQIFLFWIGDFVVETLMISRIIRPSGQWQSKPIVSYKQSWYSKDNTFVA